MPRSVDIFNIHAKIMDDYKHFVSSFINIKNERIREVVEAEIDAGKYWPEPLIQFNPSFEEGESIESLAQTLFAIKQLITCEEDINMEIVNPGALQFGITPEKLAQPHESKPWNPIIANVFYRAGIIERWGMGTLNIIDWCAENGNPKPAWHEQAGSVYVTFHPAALPAAQRGDEKVIPEVAPEVTPEVAGEVAGEVTGEVADEVRRLLQILDLRPLTRSQAQLTLGLKGQANFRDRYLTPALAAGLIELTIPDKPRSSKQKYRLTDKGKRWLADR